MITDNEWREMTPHADQAFKKLFELNEVDEDPDFVSLVNIVIKKLAYQNDEQVALWLFTSILFHDKLAEVLNGRL